MTGTYGTASSLTVLRTFVLCLAALPMVISPPFLAAAGNEKDLGPKGPPEGFSPRWSEGDTWTQKVFYRKLMLGRKQREDKEDRAEQEDAIYWVYRVTKIQNLGEAKLSRVLVKDKDKARSEVASLKRHWKIELRHWSGGL